MAKLAKIDKLNEHLIDLLACYYTWDLAYHKQFQILDFLQSELPGNRKNPFFQSIPHMQNFWLSSINDKMNIIIGRE